MPVLRKTVKASSYKRKAYPKRKSVRSTVLQRAKTMEYAADPVPGFVPTSRSTKEQKYLDMAVVTKDCNKSPGPADIELLNQVGQGTSVNTRVGMRYQMTGVHIRGTFRHAGPQMINPAVCGYYLIYDSEPHGQKATAQEIFNLRYTDVHVAFPNGSEGQKGGRFKYLARKEFLLGNASSGTSLVPMDGVLPGWRLINDYIPLNKLPVQCMRLNTGSSITSVQKGALLFVPFGREGAPISGSATAPVMQFSWRLYFNE